MHVHACTRAHTHAYACIQVHIQLIAYCFAVVGAVIILTSGLEETWVYAGKRGSRDWFPLYNSTAPGVLRHVSDMYHRWPISDEGNWALLWMVQAMALLLLVIHLAMTCFQPFESFSILLNTIKQMVRAHVVYVHVHVHVHVHVLLNTINQMVRAHAHAHVHVHVHVQTYPCTKHIRIRMHTGA